MSKLKHPFFLNVGAIVISIKPEADGKRIRPHRFKNVLFLWAKCFFLCKFIFFPLKTLYILFKFVCCGALGIGDYSGSPVPSTCGSTITEQTERPVSKVII